MSCMSRKVDWDEIKRRVAAGEVLRFSPSFANIGRVPEHLEFIERHLMIGRERIDSAFVFGDIQKAIQRGDIIEFEDHETGVTTYRFLI